MKQKVVTFGEIMLRLAPEGYYRFVQADTFGATYGGGEANVAVSLANYGFDAKFVTRLPNHEIGQCAINSLRKYGVDTSYIARGGDRIGIYYLEKGASQRPSKVIYDRAGSSIYTATSADFNWYEIFKQESLLTGFSDLSILRPLHFSALLLIRAHRAWFLEVPQTRPNP